MICNGKAESIRSGIVKIKGLGRSWMREKKIDDQDYAVLCVYLQNMETCVNIDRLAEPLESRINKYKARQAKEKKKGIVQ